MHKQRKNRKVFIFSLLSLLLLMSVGYAAFSQKLEIKGTSQITSKWDIEIINISEPTLNGYAEEVSKSIGEDKVSAYMEVNLYEKEDYAEYIVTVKNKGNLDAVLNNINVGTSNNSAVDITFECENRNKEYVDCNNQDEKEPLKANETKNIKVKIGYNKDYEGGETVGEASIGLEYTQTEYEPQEPEGFKSKDQYLLTYNSSGGKETYKSIYLYKGESVDLTKEVTKDYYVFKGWNTDSDADRGLTKEELNQCDIEEENNDCKELAETMLMPEEDTTLYAIFKEDEMTLDVSWTSTTNSITIVAAASADSGIAKYEFSIDKGESWEEASDNEESNIHTFSNLEHNTSHVIKVRVTSNSKKIINQTIEDKSCTITDGTKYLFDYIGREQLFTVPCKGTYTLEAWGARGYYGGLGAYTSGQIELNTLEKVYVYVGEQGKNTQNYAAYNGGGESTNYYSDNNNGSGGGATDFRLVNGAWNNLSGLKSRIMVAAGGGGNVSGFTGGYGGTLTSVNTTGVQGAIAQGATQTSGYKFGIGASGIRSSGGGGYYGGGASTYSGAGGSSFISGHSGCNAINDGTDITHSGQSIHYSGYKFINTVMKSGNESMPTHDGTSTMTGNSGNGYAKITFGTKDINIPTKKIYVPQFAENNPGDVSITYPEGCGVEYKCTYSKDEGEYITVTDNPIISFDEDGILVAKVTDGITTVTSSYIFIKDKLYVKSDGSDETGLGTIANPYATLTKAYNQATTTKESTIYIMDNITQNSAATFKSSKIITLTSSDSKGNVGNNIINTITKGRALSARVITLSEGELSLNNITIDGNNISESGGAITSNKKLNINAGTTIKNFINSVGAAPAIFVTAGGTLNINGGTISNNKILSGTSGAGAGGAIYSSNNTFNMNGGTISNNTAASYGGGIVVAGGTFTMTGGTISNNTAPTGGGIVSNATTVIKGGIIKKNKGTTSDGGISKFGGTITINGGYICKNNSPTNSYDTTATTNSNCS